ncbi:hypothetical protein OEW28_14215 [Defluviimonas sp. WL0002]|uniref:Flap endonuclease-1-like 5' DNA nuclease n=1 Tax=Albidovulum marisflavi TaxID=2984159 RepID=A0ABT2ZF98_9RHOB|nr:hypothetical protein [Defluviimonas sp. WL0002]MCV2869786.1 hypothetical protein [Defluviimonas sp. WL0002]
MAQVSNSSCRTRCWLGAALLGAVVIVALIRWANVSLFFSLLIGLVAFAASGALSTSRFCAGRNQEAKDAVEYAPPSQQSERPQPAVAAAVEDKVEEAEEAPGAARSVPRDEAAPLIGLDAALSRARQRSVEPPPEFLTAPRGGKADDLKRIRGIGPQLEALLNQTGVWHFDQIAGWRARDIALVEEKMKGFHGRITRDEWVKQARAIVQAGRGEG